MNGFVELWVYLSATPLFGLTATLTAYVAAHTVWQRLGRPAWANPVLWTVLLLATALLATATPYPTYFSGAQFIHFLLGPAVVALAWPLWQRRVELKQRALPLLAAALVGGAAAAGTAVALGAALNLPAPVLASLAPKGTTAPVAMGVASALGGEAALAAVFAVLTGLIGAVSGRYLFNLLRIETFEWRGFALGTASHGIGAAAALQAHPAAGAYAALALGLQVVLVSLLLPLFHRIF